MLVYAPGQASQTLSTQPHSRAYGDAPGEPSRRAARAHRELCSALPLQQQQQRLYDDDGDNDDDGDGDSRSRVQQQHRTGDMVRTAAQNHIN